MTTFIRIELWRMLRNPGTLVFVIGIPAMMYLIFGVTMEYGSQPVSPPGGDPRGNVTMYVMLSMAAYGAVMATSGVTGQAALEQTHGWGRQLALTPMSTLAWVINKTIVALLLAAVTIGVIFALGVLTGAEADAAVWWQSFLIAWLLSAVFALFGLAVGLIFRSETANGVSSGLLVLLGFFGNLFVPLSGVMLTIAKFTPLYGYASLVHWPLVEGHHVDDAGADPLWQVLVNLAVWTLVLVALSVWGANRSRAR